MPEAVANDRVDVIMFEGRILIRHLLSRCSFLIRRDECVERHAGVCNAVDTVGVDSQQNWFSFDEK